MSQWYPFNRKGFGASTEKCTSCNSYYALKSDETCGIVKVETFVTLRGFGDESGNSFIAANPGGVVIYEGFVYVANISKNRIQKITTGGVVTSFSTGTTTLRFNSPSGLAIDMSGNIYVADTLNHCIRKITSAGAVTLFAGSCGSSGTRGGTGSVAQFTAPGGVAVDSNGIVYVADTDNNLIRKITSEGEVSTLAGGGTTGTPCLGTSTSGTTVTCRDGTGTSARFNLPKGVAVDSNGIVYVADTGNKRIRRIEISTDEGGSEIATVSSLAGDGEQGSLGDRNGPANTANFLGPIKMAIDSSGDIYVTDSTGSSGFIRKIIIPQ